MNEESSNLAAEFYRKFCAFVNIVSTPEIAESSKLLENTFRQVNIALVNNLTKLFHDLGVNPFEVIMAASTKPYGFMPFYPSIGVGGHCIPVDPVYLNHFANKVGANIKLSELANSINKSYPIQLVRIIEEKIGSFIINNTALKGNFQQSADDKICKIKQKCCATKGWRPVHLWTRRRGS